MPLLDQLKVVETLVRQAFHKGPQRLGSLHHKAHLLLIPDSLGLLNLILSKH